MRPVFLMFHASPRDLHSFPTRRSSDLEETSSAERPRRVGLGRRLRSRKALPPPATAAMPRLARNGVSRDRKSTRLNSSHVKISYAVFCLKKKKKKSKRDRREGMKLPKI